MKRITAAILIVLSAIVILSVGYGACFLYRWSTFPVPPEKYGQLHNGMTHAEVVGLIGEPQSKSNISRPGRVAESWQYGSMGKIVVVQFTQDGSVTDFWSED
ncbi:MAG: hypothetical protein HY343_10585 [Lentisphaerae bacterium]|nr:hypothetical protein [Lentisphaerota bacterium]